MLTLGLVRRSSSFSHIYPLFAPLDPSIRIIPFSRLPRWHCIFTEWVMIQIRGCAFMWPRCASIVSFFLIKLLTNLLGLTTPFSSRHLLSLHVASFSRCPPFHAVSPFCHVVSPFLSRRLPPFSPAASIISLPMDHIATLATRSYVSFKVSCCEFDSLVSSGGIRSRIVDGSCSFFESRVLHMSEFNWAVHMAANVDARRKLNRSGQN